MLTLVTGLPGSFKTTWTLRELCGAGFADRRKFAHGVNGVRDGLFEKLDEEGVRAWESLPAGSVVLVDEAQKLFPARGMHSGAPPKWIERLAEHRHGGYDFYLITQHPTFVDAFVRKLVGRHIHLTRRYGLERANVYSWEEVQTPENSSAKEFAVKTGFQPVPEDYGRHTSATIHTVKRRLPWKKILVLVAALAGVVASVTYVVRHVTQDPVVPVPEKSGDPSDGSPRYAGGPFWDPARRGARPGYLERAESAPLYDSLQVVKSQPRLAGCADFGVSLGGKPSCYCTTPQGSLIPEISVHMCRSLIRTGWFDETRKPVDTGAIQLARLESLDSGSGGTNTGEPESKAPVAPAQAPPGLSSTTDSP